MTTEEAPVSRWIKILNVLVFIEIGLTLVGVVLVAVQIVIQTGNFLGAITSNLGAIFAIFLWNKLRKLANWARRTMIIFYLLSFAFVPALLSFMRQFFLATPLGTVVWILSAVQFFMSTVVIFYLFFPEVRKEFIEEPPKTYQRVLLVLVAIPLVFAGFLGFKYADKGWEYMVQEAKRKGLVLPGMSGGGGEESPAPVREVSKEYQEKQKVWENLFSKKYRGQVELEAAQQRASGERLLGLKLPTSGMVDRTLETDRVAVVSIIDFQSKALTTVFLLKSEPSATLADVVHHLIEQQEEIDESPLGRWEGFYPNLSSQRTLSVAGKNFPSEEVSFMTAEKELEGFSTPIKLKDENFLVLTYAEQSHDQAQERFLTELIQLNTDQAK